MKKIISFLFIFASSVLAAQQQLQSGCNFVPTVSMFSSTNYSNKNTTIVDNDQKYIFNVKFHASYGTNGENPNNVNEDFFLTLIAYLNILYNPSKIYFKYRGFNSINDDYFSINTGSIQFNELKNRFIQESKYDYSAINIFTRTMGTYLLTEGTTDITIPALFASPAYSDIIHKNQLKHYMAHNTGHLFGLLHVFDGTWAYDLDNRDKLTTNLPTCIANAPVSNRYIYKPSLWNFDYGGTVSYLRKSENVTRDPQNTFYNAYDSGDRVADTEACFGLFFQNFCPFTSVFNPDPRVVDKSSQMYVNLNNVFNNIMNLSNGNTMTNPFYFTPGQRTRMRETLLADADGVYNQILNKLPDGTPKISVLFEPYSSTDLGGSIVRTTDNDDGTANVCRAKLREHKFQPGFDYTFPGNYDTDPINVSQNDFPVPPVKLHTEDYPITIAQLGTAPENTGSVSVICTREKYAKTNPSVEEFCMLHKFWDR